MRKFSIGFEKEVSINEINILGEILYFFKFYNLIVIYLILW